MAKPTALKPIYLVLILIGLAGCQPKGSYLYQPTNQPTVENLIVVIDYLRLIDDVGKFWKFDLEHHQQQLDELWTQSQDQLYQLGYPEMNGYLLGSGLSIQNMFPAEIRDQQTEQDETNLLYPPYIIASNNMASEQIPIHHELLHLAVKYITWRRHHQDRPDSLRGMQMRYHMSELDLPDNTAILYIHIDHSSQSIGKQLGTALLTGAIASQADYGHVHFNASSHRQSSAFLLHHPSGEIMWKNHSKQWRPDAGLETLLIGLPRPVMK